MAQFALANFRYAKPPSKIRQGINHDNLLRKVHLRTEDGKNTIQIEDGREASGDGKYNWSQIINKEETGSKQVIAFDEGYQSWRQHSTHRRKSSAKKQHLEVVERAI